MILGQAAFIFITNNKGINLRGRNGILPLFKEAFNEITKFTLVSFYGEFGNSFGMVFV